MKDERSEVNHISGNADALFAEDPKGKALSGAEVGLRSSQSRQNAYSLFSFSILVRRSSSISPLYAKYFAP